MSKPLLGGGVQQAVRALYTHLGEMLSHLAITSLASVMVVTCSTSQSSPEEPSSRKRLRSGEVSLMARRREEEEVGGQVTAGKHLG